MAWIERRSDGDRWPLAARCLVGRSSACLIRLQAELVSGEHATIAWHGGGWELLDLGSKNGTYLDRARVSPRQPVPVAKGAELAFGDLSEAWILVDDGPAQVVAEDLSSGVLLAGSAGLLALPNADQPLVSVLADSELGWIAEGPWDSARSLRDGEVVIVAERPFRLHLPEIAVGTPMIEPGPSLRTVTLCFEVSQNAEHISLVARHRDTTIALGDRTYLQVLLALARQRLSDASLPVAQRGWIDRTALCTAVHMDLNAVNVAIHRARQQALSAGLEDGSRIVEVRRRERRIGTDALLIR